MDAAGGIIGPLMAYVVLKEFPGGFNILFGSAFIIGILAVLSFVFVKEVTTVVNLAKTKGTKSLPKGFFAALTVFFILSLGSLPVAVLLLKSKDEGLDLANIPLFYLIYSVCFSFLSFRAGSLADKFGDRRILVLGYIILIASYGMIMFDGVVTLIVGFILLGLSMALTDGIQRAFVSRLSDPEIRGTAIGYLNGAAGIGLTLSGVVGGILWQNFGPAFALITASFIVLIGILALISQIGRKTA
jgi:MFS family permease